jgi:hypothetical protein
MKHLLSCFCLLFITLAGYSQNFELVDTQDSYQSTFNQQVRISLKIKNTSDKSQFYIIRRARIDQVETQKSYFCLDNHCLEPSMSEFSKRVEPGEVINLNYILETGMLAGQSSYKFEIFPKGSPAELKEHSVNVNVEEKSTRNFLYQSREITVQEIYPNPVQDQAVVDYKLIDGLVKAKIVIHNVLGKPISEFELDPSENRIKIMADDMNAGVYFYTLYINSSGVATRKIMVRK